MELFHFSAGHDVVATLLWFWVMTSVPTFLVLLCAVIAGKD